MKTRFIVLALGLFSLTSCYTSQSNTRYQTSDDDIYYTKKQPEINPQANVQYRPIVKQTPPPPPAPAPQAPQANPSQGNSRFYYDNAPKTNPGQYQDSIAPKTDSIHYQANQNFNNQNETNYDDYDYASRINRFYYPYGSFGYYDPFYYPYYGYSPFYFGLGWGWNYGWGLGFGYYNGWGYPGYYGGYFGNYYSPYYTTGRFTPGTNPYAPRRVYTGGNNIGTFNTNRNLSVSSNRLISSSAPTNSNLVNRGNFNNVNTTGFVNPNISRGTFNAPSRASISNANLGRISANGTNSRLTNFRNPNMNSGNFNYSPSASARPMATTINRQNSGTRSSYFNSGQRFGGYTPNNQISRGYAPPANSSKSTTSYSRSYSPSSSSAPSRSFGGGGGGGFHGGRH